MQNDLKNKINEIKNRIEDLQEATNLLTEKDAEKIYESLNEHLKSLILKSFNRKKYYKEVIESLKKEITEKRNILNIKSDFKDFKNFFNEIKYLFLENKKLNFKIERKKIYLENLHNLINELEKEMGLKKSFLDENIENISSYEEKLLKLTKEKEIRENKRFEYLKEIESIKKYLKDIFNPDFSYFNFDCGQKIIDEIKEVMHEIDYNAKYKKMSINKLERSIKTMRLLKIKKENTLKIFYKEINLFSQILKKEVIKSENLFENMTTLSILKKENEKEFKKNFEETIYEYNEYLELLNEKNKFEIYSSIFDFNEHNFSILRQIQEELEILKPKKVFYLKLIEEIKQREELCEKIKEFEIKSSDPKRLKGSSLILFKEEAFRKKMIPKLFETEKNLLKHLIEYEESFGTFILKNVKYKERLKKEIKQRIHKKS